MHTTKSTKTLFRILEELRGRNGARVTELANELDIPKSTVHRHLNTLIELEYLTREGDLYHIGSKFLYLGSAVRHRHEAHVQIRPKIKQLAAETEERSQFMIEEHGRMVYVHRETGARAVRTNTQLGKRMPMHATSGGKAILAEMPEARVEEIVDKYGLPAITDRTISSRDELYAELQQIRDDGVSYNDQEYIDGLRAVSVPVMGPDERVLGAIGLSGPSHRLKGDLYRQELPDKLLGVVNELELNFKYS